MDGARDRPRDNESQFGSMRIEAWPALDRQRAASSQASRPSARLRRLQSEGTKIGATRLISSARSLLVWQHFIRIHFTLKAVEDLERGYDSD
jgi:hypothetical protein